MCGIAGIQISAGMGDRGLPMAGGGRVSGPEAVAAMVKHLQHRGPDDEGMTLVSGERVETFLGSTRLAILDLSANGHQPMPDPATGNWISFNGEIYNFRELLAELKIADPRLTTRSQTDTEVILKAYARWGRDCVRRLRGMFAFALWDQGRQELFLARDRLGIKPLYYYDHEGTFLFASEVRAILASGLVPRRLDPVGVWGYLAYQSVPAPRTLIQGIRVLPPGSWMTVDSQGTITGGRYWDLLEDASPDARSATREECRRRVRDLLREAISIHLVSDVPLGIFLSGGIDSSTVVALMCELGQVPRTFSVIFREQAYNEARHAQQVASRFHTDHVEILLGEQDLLTQLPEALAAMDQPTGDGVNTYVISRAVRSAGLTVALSGLGGDEFFGGYPSFRRLSKVGGLLRLWGRTPRAFRSLAGWMVEALGRSSVTAIKLASLVKSDGTLDATFPVTRQVFSDRERHALLENGWISEGDGTRDFYVQLLKEAYDRAPESELFSRVSYGEARTYMHDVLLRDTDQMSMAHALEVRVPLLDHKLVEYVMGLPDAHKRPNGTPKRLLVESLDGLLPEEIVRRPKQGFTLPFEPWMRGDFRGFCEERLGPERLGGRGLFRPERLQSLWQDFLAGRRHVSWARLWLLVALEEWLERNGVEL